MHTILERRPHNLLWSDFDHPRLRIGRRAYAALRWLAHRVLSWQARRAQRIALAQLDDRLLKDIGLNRVEVVHEIGRPFWSG